ncbi:hypothetical protein Tco_0813017 [Tanacetum coccineum]
MSYMRFSMDNSNNEENIILDEGEHTLIDDIDNNGYIMDEEDEMEPTNVFDQSMRYSILGKRFENLNVACEFYNGYGLSKGFGILGKYLSMIESLKATNKDYTKLLVTDETLEYVFAKYENK